MTEELLKELEISIIFFKDRLDPRSLDFVRGYFMQKLRIAIPESKSYSNWYLSFPRHPKSNKPLVSLPHINIVHGKGMFGDNSTGGVICYAVDLADVDLVTKLGKPRRITFERAKKLIASGEAIGIFTEKLEQLA